MKRHWCMGSVYGNGLWIAIGYLIMFLWSHVCLLIWWFIPPLFIYKVMMDAMDMSYAGLYTKGNGQKKKVEPRKRREVGQRKEKRKLLEENIT